MTQADSPKISYMFVDGNSLSLGESPVPLEAILTSSELVTYLEDLERLSPHKNYLAVSNYGLYVVENKKAFLYFGHKKACGGVNPFFKNPNNIDLNQELRELICSVSSPKSIAAATDERYATKFDLETLGFTRFNATFSYLNVNTTEYDKTLTDVQKEFVRAGYGERYDVLMKFLAERNIAEVKFLILNQEFVLKNESIPLCQVGSISPQFEFHIDINPRNNLYILLHETST